MIPHKPLTVKLREGGELQIHVVEVGFRTYLDAVQFSWVETTIAEASVRVQSSSGVFDQRVPAGWLDTVADDSVEAVVLASNKLNLSPERAKKAAALARAGAEQTAEKSASPAPKTSSA